ncbi:hypothetical protein D7M11_08020 [Paenibacillus ginsengarvi]|uniref:Uncharacterized protein n=1 Tax=Paenibacillus ginsengarvi TaxID=400777 RepID=A0A3B0CMJ8_9BACL|nr:hypothetical protein D7M11_08020 [Paenibacillus ginsengarvi]
MNSWKAAPFHHNKDKKSLSDQSKRKGNHDKKVSAIRPNSKKNPLLRKGSRQAGERLNSSFNELNLMPGVHSGGTNNKNNVR